MKRSLLAALAASGLVLAAAGCSMTPNMNNPHGTMGPQQPVPNSGVVQPAPSTQNNGSMGPLMPDNATGMNHPATSAPNNGSMAPFVPPAGSGTVHPAP